MNRKLLLLPLLLASFSLAISEEEYREVCTGNLSIQKKLICEKHRKRLHLTQRRTAYSREKEKIVVPTKSETKIKHNETRVKRIPPPAIKPYIPGAYRPKEGDGE